jgi:AdoMet-dependent heme synthase
MTDAGSHVPYSRDDFAASPLMSYYEVTLACDLVCKHCRASAQETPHPDELSTEQAKTLIDQLTGFPRLPMLVMTGGDPLKRADLFELIRHAVSKRLHVALTPSATPLATFEAFGQAKTAGVQGLGISLDGADAATHDAFRGWQGSFDRTMEMLEYARKLQLPVQVNTTITRRNFQQVDAIAELLASKAISMWSVFFLVPVGRGVEEKRILPEEYEIVFERLWHQAQCKPFAVKTTEAPHYRRYVLQQGGDPLAGPASWSGSTTAIPGAAVQPPPQRERRAPLGVGDGKGILFVSHTGEIFPAGFLPLCCGRFPKDSVVEVYQHHPVFQALRDPDRFKGRCGICEYRHVCGGSRARAYALTGDYLESDPDCGYIPRMVTENHAH